MQVKTRSCTVASVLILSIWLVLYLMLQEIRPRTTEMANARATNQLVFQQDALQEVEQPSDVDDVIDIADWETLEMAAHKQTKINSNCNPMVLKHLKRMTSQERNRATQCIQNYKTSSRRGLAITQRDKPLRYEVHTYLDNTSLVVEAGGHKGVDVHEINSRWQPGEYYILEPIETFYSFLKEKFKDNKNLRFYMYGIGEKDETFYVDDTNDATSVFTDGKKKDKVPLKVVAAKTFFDNEVEIHKRNINLMTLNCEGCEYDVIDFLLDSGYVRHVENIQYQSHRIEGVCLPVTRYCLYQQLLKKTHISMFIHPFWWESWKIR